MERANGVLMMTLLEVLQYFRLIIVYLLTLKILKMVLGEEVLLVLMEALVHQK